MVGPKGATIKRIQQQTRTYIVTPSRDKEPVFEVTGLPENVEVNIDKEVTPLLRKTSKTWFYKLPAARLSLKNLKFH